MAYVYITRSSGLGQFPFLTAPPRMLVIAATASRIAAPKPAVAPPEPVVVTPVPVGMPYRPAITAPRLIIPPPEPVVVARRTAYVDPVTQVVTTVKPAIVPSVPVGMPFRPAITAPRLILPTLIKPAITTAMTLAKTKVSVVSPMWFGSTGFARRVIERLRAPSGATYGATNVKVVAGADPVSQSITGAGAPMTGQSVSLKESDPIVAVAPAAQGITLVDRPAPTQMPLISIKPIEIETLPGEPIVKKAGIPPIVFLLMAGIALPMLFKKKRKRR